MRAPLLAQLWLSGSSSSGRPGSTQPDGVTAQQRRVLAAARRGAGVLHLGAASRGEVRQFPAPHLRNLVLVACHSVYTGLDFTHSEEKSSWFLLDYQKVPGGGGRAWLLRVQRMLRVRRIVHSPRFFSVLLWPTPGQGARQG